MEYFMKKIVILLSFALFLGLLAQTSEARRFGKGLSCRGKVKRHYQNSIGKCRNSNSEYCKELKKTYLHELRKCRKKHKTIQDGKNERTM